MCEYDEYAKTPLDYLREGMQVPDLCEIYDMTKYSFFRKYRADLIIYVKELVSQGYSSKTIAKMMGINIDSVKKLRHQEESNWKEISEEQKATIIEMSNAGINPKGISAELKIPINLVHEALKPRILLTFVQSTLQKTIERYGMDARTLTKMIREEGLVIPSTSVAIRIIEHYGNGNFPFYKPMSSSLLQKVRGEIEGDGHVRKNRDTLNPTEKINAKNYKEIMNDFKLIKGAKNIEEIPNFKEKYNKIVKGMENVQVTSFQITKAPEELPWLRYMAKCFEDEGIKTNVRVYEDHCYLEVQNTVQFQELRDKWYKDGVKILPKDYGHTPTSLLHEFEGDGSYNRKSNRISFSTHNFKEEEVREATNDIANRVNIRPTVTKETKRDFEGNRFEGEYYYLIYINRKDDVEKFFQYLERADPESLEMAKRTVPHKFPLQFLPRELWKETGLPEPPQ